MCTNDVLVRTVRLPAAYPPGKSIFVKKKEKEEGVRGGVLEDLEKS
jgi:hypothetical protein